MTPLTPAFTPAQRLALSRERLRQALHEPARAPDELTSLLQGLTRQHPTAAVLGAAGLGALLVWLRPWRRAGVVSAWVSALLPGLLPVLGKVLAAVAKDQRWPAWWASSCASSCSAATAPNQAPDQAPAPFDTAQSASGS